MSHLFLHVLREVQAQFHESAHGLEDVAMAEKTVSEAGVQEVRVSSQDIVNGGD